MDTILVWLGISGVYSSHKNRENIVLGYTDNGRCPLPHYVLASYMTKNVITLSVHVFSSFREAGTELNGA